MESTNEKSVLEVAEIYLSYKSKVKLSLRPKIECSKDAEKVLRQIWNSDQLEFVEEFKILLTANKVLGVLDVSHGGIVGTVADPGVIFACALKAAACGIVAPSTLIG